MRIKKIISRVSWVFFIIFFSYGMALADLVGTPTLILPNGNTADPIVYTSPRLFSPSYRFSGGYYDPGTQSMVNVPNAGITIPSGAPASVDTGYDDVKTKSWVKMYANAGTFDAKIYNYAYVDGTRYYGSPGNPEGYNYNAFVNTGAGVGNWYVLSGTNAPVSLAVDILFQGTIYANYTSNGNGNLYPEQTASAFFSHSMGFLDSPTDLEQNYIMAFGEAVTPHYSPRDDGSGGTFWVDNWDYTKFATVPLLYWEPGTEVHEINNIIRSQAFTVTPGVPFRLNLALNASAYADNNFGAGEAYTNFYDPSLVGFSIYMGKDAEGKPIYGNLNDLGYSVAAAPVPEPATMLLLGSGLIGLAGYGRKKFFKK
jgi:hypothetical protein